MALGFFSTVLRIGRLLVGVWIGGVWNGHFPESEKYFSEAESSKKKSLKCGFLGQD